MTTAAVVVQDGRDLPTVGNRSGCGLDTRMRQRMKIVPSAAVPGQPQKYGWRFAVSQLAYDSATYGWPVWALYRAMLKDIHDSSLEVKLRGRWAL